jgi:hypothetical protein
MILILKFYIYMKSNQKNICEFFQIFLCTLLVHLHSGCMETLFAHDMFPYLN